MGKNGSIVGHIDSSRVVFAQTDCVVSGDFEIVDVSDPTNPIKVGGVSLCGGARNFEISKP